MPTRSPGSNTSEHGSSTARAVRPGERDVGAARCPSTRAASTPSPARGRRRAPRPAALPSTSAVAVAIRAFGFGRARRRATSQPGQLARRQVLADLLGNLGSLLALGPAGQVGRVPGAGVPARRHVQVGRATVELEHLGRDLVEHVAIVGDQHQPAAVGGQPLLEELDGIEIEVVGRLVEDQHLVLADQQTGQRGALGLATGQLVGRRVEQRRSSPAGRASPRPATRRRPPRAPSRPAAPGSAARNPTRTPRPQRTSPASGRSSPAEHPQQRALARCRSARRRRAGRRR